MRRLIAPSLALLLSLSTVVYAQQGNIPDPRPNCGPFGGVVPAGQQSPTTIEPSQPIWCYPQPQSGPATRQAGINDWIDQWDNDGPAIQTLNDGDYDYRVFDFTQREQGVDRIKAGKFINVNHWMLDIGDTSPYRLSGGVLLSPNKSFHSEVNPGREPVLVVEADMAAGSAGMGGADAYYEIDITPASHPTGITADPLYGYGQFGTVPTVGCRFETAQDGGHVVCAAYDDTGRDAGGTCVNQDRDFHPLCTQEGPGRIWEAQGAGTAYTAASVQGGYPGFQAIGSTLRSSDFWRICAADDAPTPNSLDLYCRDRMRIEFRQSSIDIFVNGGHVYSISGLYAQNPHNGADNRINFLDQPTYVYLTSWINSGIHHAVRWHWDRVAVNPHDADGSLSRPTTHPNYCYGRAYNTCPPGEFPAPATPTSAPATAVPTAPATATTVATPVPATRTPTAVPTSAATPMPCQVQVTIGGQRRPAVNC